MCRRSGPTGDGQQSGYPGGGGNVCKARAAVAAAKVDFLPNVAVVGGYLNQTAATYIQPNIGYVGIVGSYTFVDWGKRKNILRERENLVCLATLKLQQTEDENRQKATTAFGAYTTSQAALQLAGELLSVARKPKRPPSCRPPSSPLLKIGCVLSAGLHESS